MAQRSPPHRRRALIVEDEILFAINLEADMHALGFDICDLAANGQQASMLAMSNQPDVVLMDINLEGGREGIEVARWLRKVCEAPIVFVTGYTDHDTVERIHEQVPEHRCRPNRSIVTAFPTPWRRFPRSSTTTP
jgi:DNA-binding NarL/FixJ family response regulator